MIKPRPTIFSLALFTITLLVFSRLSACSFTWWDDQETIHQNPRLNPPTLSTLTYYWTTAGEHQTMGLYVPVTYTLWAGLAKIGHLAHPDAEGISLSATVFHAANICIHATTAVVVFWLLLTLFRNASASLFGAILFAVHPVQVETVGWASGTKDLLCGLFSCLALLMYARCNTGIRPVREESEFEIANFNDLTHGPEARVTVRRYQSRKLYFIGMLFFALGMLSKPTAVIVPLMAAVVAIFLLNQKVRPTLYSLLPWFVLMIPCIIWTQKVQPPVDILFVKPWRRPLIAADATSFYLCKLAWPMRLCIDYGHNPGAVLASYAIYFSWLVPALITVILFYQRNRHRTIIASALLFVLPLLPVLGFVPFEFQLHSTTADHYLYLPMLGAAVFLSHLMARFPKLLILASLLLTTLAVRSLFQESTWQNTRTLLTHVLQVNPQSIGAMDTLGFVTGRDARRFSDAGQTADAQRCFQESIDWYRKSLELGPDSAPSLLNLALNYQAIHRQDLWQAHIQAMKTLPEDPLDLARALAKRGDVLAALAWLDELIRRKPDDFALIQARDILLRHHRESPN